LTAGVGINPGLLELAVTLSVWISLLAPELIPLKFTVCCPAPSFTVTLLIESRVGVWFTPLTVTVKLWVTTLLLTPPSLTVTVIVADPYTDPTGVKLKLPVGFGLV